MEQQTESKHLEDKGESDYDYKNDILFFKIRNREYVKSIDFEDFVVDVDKEGFITGIQIFDASKIFRLDKTYLREVRGWKFNAKVENNIITIQLMFEVIKRNKVIIERGENLVRESTSPLVDSEVLCRIEA